VSEQQSAAWPLILGSRSPQRRELVSLLWPAEQLEFCSPPDEQEPGFSACRNFAEVCEQLQEIARLKADSVQLALGSRPWRVLLTADTEVIAEDSSGMPIVLGKPDGPGWEARVREWFQQFYFDRTHRVATAVCLRSHDGKIRELLAVTEVRFHAVSDDLLDWYLHTGEPLGKAGGYGIQGAGSLFLESISGSLSNVVGLPLEPVWEVLRDWEMI
jgi:septum formation protein